MAKKVKLRPTAWALTVAAWDVWRRLPPKQRRQALALAHKHGTKVAKHIVKSRTAKKK
jgi:hypothetical protein